MSALHVDSNNMGPSMIVGVGNYKDGALFTMKDGELDWYFGFLLLLLSPFFFFFLLFDLLLSPRLCTCLSRACLCKPLLRQLSAARSTLNSRVPRTDCWHWRAVCVAASHFLRCGRHDDDGGMMVDGSLQQAHLAGIRWQLATRHPAVHWLPL